MKSNIYTTSDLPLASTITLFYKVMDIDRSNPKKVIFRFEKDKNFDILIERYWRGDLAVNPQELFSRLKILKNRIYNQ